MTSLTLKQQTAIDRLKEELVPAAEKLLDEADVANIPKRQFGDSQLRNLIAIANETESPAVVVVLNYVKYQMGRDPRGQNWGRQHDGKKLGDRLLEDLQSGVIRDTVAKVPDVDKDPVARQLATMELIRQYLGFASRYMKYLDLQRR